MSTIKLDGKREANIIYEGESFFDNQFEITGFGDNLDTDYTYKVYKNSEEVISYSDGNNLTVDTENESVIIYIAADTLEEGLYKHELKSTNVNVDVKFLGTGTLKLC